MLRKCARPGTILILLLCLPLGAEPLHTYDFEDASAAQAWNHKDNTTLDPRPPQPFQGQGALRFTVNPAKFSYGWVHTPLPEIDFTSLSGISGAFGAPRGAQGQLMLYFCIPLAGKEMSYFRGDVGRLSESDGEWVEFCVSLADMRYERGPVKTLRAAALKPGDLLQFGVGIEGRAPVAIDLDQVQLLPAADTEAVARRCAQAVRLRELLPENETSGRPHPRLFFTPEQLARYRAKAKAGDERQAAYERLIAEAEGMLKGYNADDPLADIYSYVATSKYEGTEWRAGFEGCVVRASFPIEILGAAYRLTGQEKFGAHGAKALVNAAKRLTTDEPFLNRGFYYTRTFYVRALGFGYDWLWDRLTPEERHTVKVTLLGFVKDIHEHSLIDSWGRRPLHRVWNWDPGLMGACGIGMLALEGETRLAENAILFDCRRHLRDYLTLGIDADGCGHEGPNYLGYGIGAGVEFVEALRQQDRGDLFTETNYQLIAPWLIAETLPDGKRWNNLSDCGHGQRAWPAYLYACGRLAELAKIEPAAPKERWASVELHRPLDYLQHFAEAPGRRHLSYPALAGLMGWEWREGPGRAPPAEYDARTALAHVLLYEPCAAVDNPGKLLPLALHFQGRGLVVCRTGFGPDDVHLAIEAGPHAAGHDQSDKGTFTLGAYGADLAIDSGYGNDGDPKKSGSSYAHNVILIDGEGQPMRYHNQSSGWITGFKHTDLLDWTRTDARDAWGVRYDADWVPMRTSPVARADRTFLFVRPAEGVPPYLVVHDDIVKDGAEHAYTWQWHIPAQTKFEIAKEVWTASPRNLDYPVLASPPSGPAGAATFRFKAPKAGRYVIYGLVRAGGPEPGKSDSFFVSVDGGERLLWDIKAGEAPTWAAVANRGEQEARVFELTAGEHTLRLETRERQAELARWLVMPEDAGLPLDPEETPPGAVSIGANEAKMEKPGFEIRLPSVAPGPGITMDVFPAHPLGGEVTKDWFMTSREGAHPRLQYTVKAVEPNILTVLVPRLTDTPRPAVSPLEGTGGSGVTVQWPGATDHLVFARREATFGKINLTGSAGFVRVRDGAVKAWGVMDGTRLEYDGKELHRSTEPTEKAAVLP